MEIEHSHNKNDIDDNDDDGETMTNDGNTTTWCPLFMTGLPRDFSTNPALAAIASLMDEHASANEDDAVPIVAATNKSATEKNIVKRNQNTKYKSYTKSNRKTKLISDTCVDNATTDSQHPLDRTLSDTSTDISGKSSATTTIGEASLFMKMWKL